MRDRRSQARHLWIDAIEVLEARRLLSAVSTTALAGLAANDRTVISVPLVATSVGSSTAPFAAAVAQPSLLLTQADFDRMAAKVEAGEQPWLDGWNVLISDGYSQLGASPRTLQTVVRGGTGQNFNQMVIDIQRAYQLALRWKVSGDTRYADLAVTFLNAWASTHTMLTGNADRFLASGLYAYDWAVAADIMRSYSGWAAADVNAFQDYLVNVYTPLQRDFLTNHNGASITNYWANWDLANIQGMMAVGIFAGRQDLYDEAMDYLHTGGGNGALDKAFYYRHPGHLVQWQEAGRDQGHTILGMQLFGHIAQMAWNQGDDLFAYNNYQFLAAAEYIAKYNLGYDVPYTRYSWGTGQSGTWSTQPGISPAGRGDRDVGYELIYAHYVGRLGMAAPYTTQRVLSIRPEGRGSGDDMGFGTLAYARDITAVPQAPRGLTALEKGAGTIELSWFGGANNTSYNVYRSTSVNGTYTLVASGISDLLTYADRNLAGGVYYYSVSGVSGSGETAKSNVVGATSASLSHAQLRFNETGGTAAADATGNGHTGTLHNGATWVAGKSGNAVLLDGVNDYVSLPAGIAQDLGDFTIAAWVNLNSAVTWSRIFDFGDERGRWMFLTPRNNNGVVEFATSTVYGYNKQSVVGNAALPANQWVHVAVTFADRTATLYVNGVAVSSNSEMDFPPFQIGATTQNWIGRSQFDADPYLQGRVDDFGIYRGALKAGEVYTLATGVTPPAAPTGLTASAEAGNQVRLQWSAVAGATSYVIKRATTSGGPYTVLANGITGTGYVDSGLKSGATYYYVVAATNMAGEGTLSTQVIATTSDLHAHLKMDDSAGTVATDSTGNGGNATLVNGPIWSTSGKVGGAVSLDGVNDYLSISAGVVSSLATATIATWVNLGAITTWSRIFDFGTGTGVNMFLTPRGSSGVVRFAITTGGGNAEQRINGTAALPAGVWTHVAVTLSGSVGILYVNGVEVGRNTLMMLTPGLLGNTTQNYIGRSQYSADPYLRGSIDDFRIYARAMSASEVSTLAGTIVVGLAVNDGATQRSMIRSLTVSFNQPITPAAAAVTLYRRSAIAGGAPTQISGFTLTTSNDGRSQVLSFTGASFPGNSLADGVYDLIAMGTTYTFHRLFGDADGDGDVDGVDSVAFNSTYRKLSTSTGYLWYFDSDNDNDVDGIDAALFNTNYRAKLTY